MVNIPACTRQTQRGFTLLEILVVLVIMAIGTAMAGIASGDIPWGAGHHEAFAKYFDRTVNMGLCCEDLPEEHNTVTLDPSLTDSNGIPAPKITYRVSENSRRMLQHG
ncbi:MAG: type II secretion system protein, partial [Proteobacteria bacterium]|nr:type II secretion system protein [Pseudomonadota bacterium]